MRNSREKTWTPLTGKAQEEEEEMDLLHLGCTRCRTLHLTLRLYSKNREEMKESVSPMTRNILMYHYDWRCNSTSNLRISSIHPKPLLFKSAHQILSYEGKYLKEQLYFPS